MTSVLRRTFVEMRLAAFVDGALSKKAKELIAVGISFVIEMGGGPATAHARFALRVMATVSGLRGRE